MPLYKTFVRPKLEFSVAAWSPWLEKDAEALEKVQKRMIRMLSDAEGDSYETKLQDVGLTTLRERRTRGDLIEAYKTMKGYNNVDKRRWFTLIDDDQNRPSTRSNTNISQEGRAERRLDVLERERPRLDLRANFYTVRIVKTWNGLPDYIKNSRSVNGFKNAYDRWKENKPNEENSSDE